MSRYRSSSWLTVAFVRRLRRSSISARKRRSAPHRGDEGNQTPNPRKRAACHDVARPPQLTLTLTLPQLHLGARGQAAFGDTLGDKPSTVDASW